MFEPAYETENDKHRYAQEDAVEKTEELQEKVKEMEETINGPAINDSGVAQAPIKKSKKKKYREREQWGSKVEFILSCMAFSIGLGNVWRFPYLCYKNGGGAFLIPYFICLILGGIPIYFLEVGIGQYWQNGGITVWNLVCPLFKGIGYGTSIICFILNIYYIIILAWALLYFYYSFNWTLPWSTCDNDWNTEKCWSEIKSDSSSNGPLNKSDVVDSVVEFWENKILMMSSGVDVPGGFQWQLVLTLAIMWIINFFCIWRGIKSTGKAVYFTAIFPYVMMTILFIRGVTLPGALSGLTFYLKADITRLQDSQVWIDAGTQIFFSYAIALGTMTALGSYNRFHNNFYHQLFFVTGMNSGTSLFAGFAIFSVIGFMAHQQGKNVGDVVRGGPGLAFIAYPKGVAQMPWPTLWALLFFIMILLLGLGSQFVAVEGFVTAWVDYYPRYLRKGKRREVFIGCICLASFIIGLSMVTKGGIYVFQLFDYYGASGLCLLWMCFFESLVLGWIYKSERFEENAREMIGFRMSPWFRVCWKYLTPLFTGGIFIFSIVRYKRLKYNDVYDYPDWAIGCGLCLALSSMIAVPIHFFYSLATTPGNTLAARWKVLTTPSPSPYLQNEANKIATLNKPQPV